MPFPAASAFEQHRVKPDSSRMSQDEVNQAPAEDGVAELLAALDVLESVFRQLHPPRLPMLVARALPAARRLPQRRGPVAENDADPNGTVPIAGTPVQVAAGRARLAFDELAKAASDREGLVHAYRAMRAQARALEALYEVAASMPAVSRFFVEPARRDDIDLLGRLAGTAPASAGAGVTHWDNDLESRGGYSLYVPEGYTPDRHYPLIVALHGGSGHGADFLWTWLREARTREAIVVSPTARGRTWSLNMPEVDDANIRAIVRQVGERWNIDSRHRLLTGMSDGGTFTMITGLRAESSFTHLAPFSASFHPGLVDRSSPQRLARLPVYLVHGVLDWMFPVDFAHIANAALTRAGARVVFREITDLSHTYARDENPRVMDWFLGGE